MIARQVFYNFDSESHLQTPQDILNNLISSGLATQVGAQQLALLQVGINGSVDLGSSLGLLEELEHQSSASQSGNGVGNVLSLDIGSTSVARLANGEALADVGAGDETETANKSGGAVGKDIAVQVRGNNDVVGLRLAEELVDHGVDNLLLDGDGRVLWVGQGVLGGGAEEAVGLGEDVGLVGDCDEGLAVDAGGAALADLLAAQRNVAGHGGDAEGRLFGDALDGLGDLAIGGVARRLLLDVEVLGVLAHNDHVDGLGGGHDGLDGADVCVEVEALAQGDNGRRVALDGVGGRADGAEEGALALVAQDVDGGVGQRGARLLKGLEAGLEVDKVELELERRRERLEDAAAGGDDFLADAVTGDEPWRGGVVFVSWD